MPVQPSLTFSTLVRFLVYQFLLCISFLVHFLAEFIIMLGKKSKSVEKFKTRLGKNGADFPVCLAFYDHLSRFGMILSIYLKFSLKYHQISNHCTHDDNKY